MSTTMLRSSTLRTPPRSTPTRSNPPRGNPTRGNATRGGSTVDAVEHHPSTVRLTRRGRAVVIGLALFAVLCVLALRGAPAASTDLVHHPKTATVVVAPGETVWDIARRVAPGSDPRSVVGEIERLNSLSDAGAIQVGQPLFVPRH